MGSSRIFILLLLAALANAELEGLLDSMPSDVFSSLGNDGEESMSGMDSFKSGPDMFSMPSSYSVKAPVAGKVLKTAVMAPVKKVIVKKKVVAAKIVAAPKIKVAKVVAAPKIKVAKVIAKKPKVHTLKPIVHVIEKPVPVYHKVPVPKKVIVPKFYPVKKFIPVPKIVPVPFKVPVKKIIPKIVKIPKAIPIPKIVPVKKPVPIAIPYPVPKYYRFPVPKPVPYAKYIPIPIKKKVPKFIPVPVKKIIKVPKPYYVPVKVPYVTKSYVRAPMVVDVPDVKKLPMKGSISSLNPMSMKSGNKEDEFLKSIIGGMQGESDFKGGMSSMGEEDKELLKMLTNSVPQALK